VLVGALLVAAGAYTAYWYSAAAELRAGIARWAEDRRDAGWRVDLGDPDIAGFPLRLEALFQTPRISGPDARWRWVAPNIRAVASPWRPQKIFVSAPGIHVVTTRAGDVWTELGRAEADIVVDGARMKSVVARTADVGLRLPGGEEIRADSAIMRVLGSAPAAPSLDPGTGAARPDSADKGIGVALDIRQVLLPDRWRPALGRTIGKVALDAVILGDIVPEGPLEQVLTGWRDGGGTIEVAALALDWGVLRLRTNGTFALDDELQPEGAVVADIRGVDATMERLLAAGVIDSRTAFAARIANGVLSFGGGAARLPLSLQKQRLYIGPAPILRVKTVRWN
tara:strand:+ start:1716 stop:2732 length:1017 start_codon:yes stop_codon:yes gene_type:complete